MHERIVVTAAGVVSPIGAGLENFACALYAARSAASVSTRFRGVTTAEITDFQPQVWLGNKGIRVLDRSARLLAVASQMALTASGLSQESAGISDPELGLVCGTVFGSVHSITGFDWSGMVDGPTLVNPSDFPNTVINAPAGQAAIKHRLRGINSTVCAGQSSGLQAIQYAADALRFGRAHAILAGGVEEMCGESMSVLRKTGALSSSGCARPFSPDRDGIVPGEGSALWMLETLESAEARGHAPWLEVGGFGATQAAYRIDAFDLRGDGPAEAMRDALANSRVGPGDISCIVTSANGSREGDEMEMRALEKVFGRTLTDIPLCSPKAVFGEAMGASGALCALTAGLALQEQSVPPTPGYSHTATPIHGEYALVNAFGSDGNSASLVVRLWKN